MGLTIWQIMVPGALVYVGYVLGFRLHLFSTINDNMKTDEEITEFVIKQATDAYVEGRIDLDRFELDVENLLQGRTPVNKEGWPLYYDPRILDHVNY